MNEIKVSTENVQKAFHAAGENPAIRELLINLFGKENIEPEQSKDVTERIVTFEDACSELGENHQCVAAWNEYKYTIMGCESNTEAADITAYMKLRVICAALNEGWKPKITEDEYRYSPFFYLYKQEEIDTKSDEWKQKRHIIGTDGYETEYDGFSCDGSIYVHSRSGTDIGSRLCLKSKALAMYCGTHFIHLWADFNLIKK